MRSNYFHIIFFCLILSSVYSSAYAQESSHYEIDQFSVDLDLKYKQLYLSETSDDYKLRVDPEVSQNRKKDTLAYSSPFQHSALYFKVGFNVAYKNKYKLDFNTFFEQRSWSAGVNNLDRYVVFPQFRFDLTDTITLGQHDLDWMFKLGNIYTDNELTSGLRAYNIDLFGYIAKLKHRKSKLSLFYSGDMYSSIGLLINDYCYLKYSRLVGENLEFGASFSSASNFRFKPKESKWYPNYGLYVKKDVSDIELLIMLEYADKKIDLLTEEKYANLGGFLKILYEDDFHKTNIKAEGNIRYFGANYISGHYGGSAYLYRSNHSREARGEYLYPLKNYFRPLSQFALYSEYRPTQIISYELSLNWKQKLFNKISHDVDLEVLNLNTDGFYDEPNTSFTYYYYTYFLYYNIFPGFKAGFYLTNKLMNVDVLYQTFYQSDKPFIGIHFTWDGKFRLK